MLRKHVRLLTCGMGPSKVVALGVVKALLSKRPNERKKEHRMLQPCIVWLCFQGSHEQTHNA